LRRKRTRSHPKRCRNWTTIRRGACTSLLDEIGRRLFGLVYEIWDIEMLGKII